MSPQRQEWWAPVPCPFKKTLLLFSSYYSVLVRVRLKGKQITSPLIVSIREITNVPS